MKKNIFKYIFIVVLILGIITPYIDYFVVVQMFFLLIPFIGILAYSLILFIFNSIKYKKRVFKLTSTKIIILLPLFLFTQIISMFIVDKVQRFRSEQIIFTLKNNSKIHPKEMPTTYGIKYNKFTYSNNFNIEYKRGFFVREIYNSESKTWKSYGWRD
ncbi:hypothetical protein [Chryseobacterium turcicum]|uniref:Uncharacterized protein n=1 Tax=Chryseobacterium turcicum TaxID=2898076 RepID=A0A9Q3V7C2_9FLAO|nr:hypothetical protein [Chryseobacterium turcicum]MCD1118956.1 hypothetical protein [Chryseobacterium turcicum]